MNATHLDEIRRLLIQERERIATEWANHGGDAGPGDDWNLKDPEERATQLVSGAVDRRIAEDDLNLLHKVEFALQRLDAGTYERCDSCGQVIPIDRLLAKPSVSLCLACQLIKDAAKP